MNIETMASMVLIGFAVGYLTRHWAFWKSVLLAIVIALILTLLMQRFGVSTNLLLP